jgi:hypothetical protein
MKKITVLFLLLSFSTFAQDLNFLDSNNGYKKFKFGKSPEEISEIKKVTNWDEKYYKSHNILPYEYVGNEITSFFNSDIIQLDLDFYNKKLFRIGVLLGEITEDFSLEDFEELKNQLSTIFGSKYYNIQKEKSVVKGYIWTGEKVRLELTLFNFDYDLPKSERRRISCSVYIYHNGLNLEMKKNQF